MPQRKTTSLDTIDIVINTIKGSDERIAQLGGELKNHGRDYRLLYGTLGKELTSEQKSRYHKTRRYNQLEPNEIACVLGHEECLRTFLETDKDYCLLLEDDAVINPDVFPVLEKLINETAGWDMVMLEHRRKTTNGPLGWSCMQNETRFQLVFNRRTTVAVTGTIYTRIGAQKAISSLRSFSLPIDLHFREAFRYGIVVAEFFPSLIVERKLPSIIGGRVDNKVKAPDLATRFHLKIMQNVLSVARWFWARRMHSIVKSKSPGATS